MIEGIVDYEVQSHHVSTGKIPIANDAVLC